jgi:hypothetical protein
MNFQNLFQNLKFEQDSIIDVKGNTVAKDSSVLLEPCII